MLYRLAIAMVSTLFGAAVFAQGADNLEKFVDEMPVPARLQAQGPEQTELTVTMDQIRTKLHRDLPETLVWGYDGSSPGPTIEVERGQALRVHWHNDLPASHVFPVPMGGDMGLPDVRTVTHLHGAAVAEPDPTNRQRNDDGWPDAWITPGQEQLTEYPNDQSARMLWYHDHAMGTTGRNVAAGMYGLYAIRDDYERSLNLPSGAFEIPLAIQTRKVNDDGTLGYVDDITAEFYGNAVDINGKLWPYLNVEPRKYRFRFVNVSNARSYAMKLVDAGDGRTAGPAFYQIGSDSGFLAETVVLNDPARPSSPRLILAPAERADVVIDFSRYAGKTLTLSNNSHDPSDDEVSLPEMMQFRVAAAVSVPDTSSLPVKMQPIPRLDPAAVATTRQIVFDQMTMPDGMVMLTLNGRHWRDPIEEKPVLGTTEVWELVNPLNGPHPFHMHLVQFQVLDRRLFDVGQYLKTGETVYLADAVPPAPNEMGWKDTVRVLPQMVTRIIMRFEPYTGFFVYHCHILEHEDMDMMRPFQVVQP